MLQQHFKFSLTKGTTKALLNLFAGSLEDISSQENYASFFEQPVDCFAGVATGH